MTDVFTEFDILLFLSVVFLLVLFVEFCLLAAQYNAPALNERVSEGIGAHIKGVAIRNKQRCIFTHFECSAGAVYSENFCGRLCQ